MRLSAEAERAHYLTHENDPADPRYRAFLGQLWQPLRERLPAGAHGLDYGSGPGPTLHRMAAEDGFPCAHYDPFFTPDPSCLDRTYAFVTCSETAEHFHRPAREFARLGKLLQPGGWLGVMTERLPAAASFPEWYYLRDPTHVCFYAEETFRWIAANFGFGEPEFPGPRVCLMQAAAGGR